MKKLKLSNKITLKKKCLQLRFKNSQQIARSYIVRKTVSQLMGSTRKGPLPVWFIYIFFFKLTGYGVASCLFIQSNGKRNINFYQPNFKLYCFETFWRPLSKKGFFSVPVLLWSFSFHFFCHLLSALCRAFFIFLTLTLKMTTAQVVETSVTINNNSPIQDYVHPDDQTQPTFEMTPGFKPFTEIILL